MSNSVACGFDNAGSKCKNMYRFKISAKAGIQSEVHNSPLTLSPPSTH
jgi:hypothetical protein